MDTVRTRFAPSPTGSFHMGSARTALFIWLFARQRKGEFLLRFEDTDKERSSPEFEEEILEGLTWLDITWDGPIFHQSNDGLKEKRKFFEQLKSTGAIFRCPHEKSADMTGAPHVCDARDGSSKTGIYRFRNDATDIITFNDIVHGAISVDPKTLGDFAVAIDDDHPLFLFANAIDDVVMRITHVIRGDDHIANTPKQILLLRALALPEPAWAHIPLLLGSDRSKLSKRHGTLSVLEYRKAGYLPDALVNFLALLGWHPDDEREIFTRDELLNIFTFERIQKSGAIFDDKKLDWINHAYIQHLKDTQLAAALTDTLTKENALVAEENGKYRSAGGTISDADLMRIARVEKSRLYRLSDITKSAYFFEEPIYDPALLLWKGTQENEGAIKVLMGVYAILEPKNGQFLEVETIEALLLPFAQKEGKGEVLWPLRVALSGEKASPSPFELIYALGVTQTLTRIRSAIHALENHSS